MEKGLKELYVFIIPGSRTTPAVMHALIFVVAASGLCGAVYGNDSVSVRENRRAFSPDSSSQIKELDTMVVTARQCARYSPAATVLDTKDFSGKYQDLPSVLEAVSGVTVRDMGGFGHYAEAAIRGCSSNQVQVFLDGMPLNGATGAAVDISKIPLSTVQEITIYKSIPPLEFFGDNAGGAITLTTAATKEAATASLEAGSFGYRAAAAVIDKRYGSMTHRLSVDYGYAANDYSYVDSLVTHSRTVFTDNQVKTMDNNFFSTLSGSYANSWEIDEKLRFTTLLSAKSSDEGIFYLPTADSNDGSVKNRLFSLMTTYAVALDTTFSYTLSARGKTEEELFERSRSFYNYSEPVRQETDQPHVSLSGIATKKIGGLLSITGLASGSYDGYDCKNLNAPSAQLQPHFFRLIVKAGMEGEMHVGETFAARLGGIYRSETDSTNGHFDFSATMFSSGGLLTTQGFPGGYAEIVWTPLGAVQLQTGLRYSSRSPGFTEKFSQGVNYAGNDTLHPETRLEYDAGVSINKPGIASSLSFFVSDTKDKIIFLMQSQHMFYPRNMNEVAGIGAESYITFAPVGWMRLTNAATYMENVISSVVPGWNEKNEPLLPRFTDDLNAKVAYKKLYACHSARFESSYFLNPDNTLEVAHRLPELTVTVGISPSKHFDCSYRLENYLNFQDYDFPDRPIPGRRHYFVLKYNY
jgi:outer membrane cobalamin receptor